MHTVHAFVMWEFHDYKSIMPTHQAYICSAIDYVFEYNLCIHYIHNSITKTQST